MNAIEVCDSNESLHHDVYLPASKSLSNRWLIIQQAFPQIQIQNLSESDDSQILQKALRSNDDIIDVHHAGTAMRFLTALLSVHGDKPKMLKGSNRMHNRPILDLVEALKDIGAEIDYLYKDGFPPLLIHPKKLQATSITVEAKLSSQYISAILLIVPFLGDNFRLSFASYPTSVPYIQMTLKVLEACGYSTKWENQTIFIQKIKECQSQIISIESDWSSASYFYSLIALSKAGEYLTLKNLQLKSWQGDSIIHQYFLEDFGIQSVFTGHEVKIKKLYDFDCPTFLQRDFKDIPDMAQTWAVTASALKIPFKFTGLHTLRIKETDRLTALQNELKKIGVSTKITSNSIESIKFDTVQNRPIFKTYDDHRMALSFAVLAKLFPIQIQNPKVVSKSFPNYWTQLQSIGFKISNIN